MPISLNEIATTVGLSRNTGERYIGLLEKSLIVKGSASRRNTTSTTLVFGTR
jgi:predicted AAA+ superfamily ATPase